MDARPILFTLARVLHEHGLEAVLIGNAAAALQGAPVTTLDFDFLFRKTPRNMTKLKAVARSLGAVLWKPYYSASDRYRISRDVDSLQLDFMTRIHGVRYFSALRSRASKVDLGGHPLLVAHLTDIIGISLEVSERRTDRRVGQCWRFWKERWMKRKRARLTKLEALKLESDRQLREQIRRLLAKPPDRRTHFLRKRISYGASCL